MILTDLLDEARSWANDPSASGFVGDTELANFMTAAQFTAYNAVRMADKNYFEEPQTIALVDGQQEYDLPATMRRRSITLVQTVQTDGSIQKVSYIRHQDVPRTTTTQQGIPWLYYLIGDTIGFYPIPQGVADARIVFVRQPNSLFQARRAIVGPGDTFEYTIDEGAAVNQGRVGRLPTSDNHLVGEIIRFHPNDAGGFLGAGEEYRITEHDVAARTFSVTPDLSAAVSGAGTANGSGAVFSTLSLLGEEFRPYLTSIGAAYIHRKQRAWNAYQSFRGEAADRLKQILDNIEMRRLDEPQFVRDVDPWPDNYGDVYLIL